MASSSAFPKSRRPSNAPARSTAIPPTPESLFFPLTLYATRTLAPPATSISANVATPTDPTLHQPNEFSIAMAKIIAAERRLPREMVAGLKAVLTVTHNHLSGATPHDFITLLASDETTDEKLAELANTIDAGLTAFLARGGPTTSAAARSSEVLIVAEPLPDPPTPPSASSDTRPPAKRRKTLSKPSKPSGSTRSKRVKSDCKERDGQICCVTGQEESGLVSHIIPHGSGAVDFWKMISLLRGGAETAALRQSALGPGNTTDVLLNVWWVWEAVHSVFDKGHITVVPDLSLLQFPYHPDQVTEVYLAFTLVCSCTQN